MGLYFWRDGGGNSSKLKRVTLYYPYAELFTFDDNGNIGIIYSSPGKVKYYAIKNPDDNVRQLTVKYVSDSVFEITTWSWSNITILGGTKFSAKIVL